MRTKRPQRLHVDSGAGRDDPFDEPEEHALLALAPQQQRRERRRQREGVESRERDRERDRQRELLIEPAGRAGEERDGHEHGDEHERRRHHRAEHLAHRLAGRLERRAPVLVYVPLDVLDDHDRIVDDDAGRERDAEESQGIDREAEQIDEGEGADERHRDRDGRDDRRAPVLQEEEHHEHDERNRLEQRLEHLADRVGDDRRVVEGDLVLEARREALREARELRAHTVVDVEGVGRRQLRHAHADRVASVEPETARVRLGSDLGAADVAAGGRACRRAVLQDDVFEVSRLGQPAGGAHRDLVRLIAGRGRLADGAGRNLHVLLAQSARSRPRRSARATPGAWDRARRRIAYLRSPKIVTSATPGMRLSASRTKTSR